MNAISTLNYSLGFFSHWIPQPLCFKIHFSQVTAGRLDEVKETLLTHDEEKKKQLYCQLEK